MRTAGFIALACLAYSATAIANPFEQFKGKMKEGMYEYKMEMDMGNMPGMPAGMGKQTMSFQKCLTAQDIDKGNMGRGGGPGGRGGQMPENCEVKDMNVSGNTATYKMVCKPPNEMTVSNKIMFKGDGFVMDMDMAMNQRGQMMNMKQHMESRYLGPCK